MHFLNKENDEMSCVCTHMTRSKYLMFINRNFLQEIYAKIFMDE